jgi:ABC-type transporter Mla MlaB component
VVALGSLGFLGYCVHRYSEVVDHNEQRANDLAKLKEADAQALEVVKRHTEREQQAGKQLPLDEASKQALAGLSKIQELIAQKQSVDPAAPPFSFFGLSGLELGAVAAGVVGAVWLFKK